RGLCWRPGGFFAVTDDVSSTCARDLAGARARLFSPLSGIGRRDGLEVVRRPRRRAREADRPVPPDDLALAARDGRAARAELAQLPNRPQPPLQALGSEPLAAAGDRRPPARGQPAELLGLALH